MIKKPNKLIQYVSIALGAVLACGVFMSSTNFSLSNIVRSRASETINGSITFTNNGSNVKSYSGSTSYYFVSSQTQTGADVYLENKTTSNTSISGLVAVMNNTSEIVFSVGNTRTPEPSHFQFQKITGVSAKSNSGTSRTLEIYTSNDGTTYTDTGNGFLVNSTGGSYTFSNNFPTYLMFTYYNAFGYELQLTELVINYTCSPVETRTLESIEVKDTPTKTEYTEGDYFDPTGLVITAAYDDGSEDDIAYGDSPSDFTFSPSLSTALSPEDTSVTITYGGKSTSQEITVSEASPQQLLGTYSYSYSATISFRLQFNSDGTGKYYRWYSNQEYYTLNFTFEQQNDKYVITIGSTYTRDQIAQFTNGYRIVQVNNSTVVTRVNDSAELDTDGSLKIDLWRYASSTHTATNYTFTKL